MDMTPKQLRFLRDHRGLTREQLAAELGDCTASTINKWERGINPVPSWVADKMFAKLPITFTVLELAEMYELCREEAYTMSELIQEAVRSLIAQRRQTQAPHATKQASPRSMNTTSANGDCHHCPAAAAARGCPPPPKKTRRKS